MKFVVGTLFAISSCLGGCNLHPLNPPPDADGAMPPSPPPVDAAPAPTSCDTMCFNLRTLGCPEGNFADCAVTCNKALSDPGVPKPPIVCVSTATSQAAVRACGLRCSLGGDH
jgi:hypothetical protein